MDGRGERLERERAAIAALTQGLDLRDIAEKIAFADQDAVLVADVVVRQTAVLDARDVDEAGPLREDFALVRQVMVEGVMQNFESVGTPDGVDRIDRDPLEAKGAFVKTQRFDKAGQAMVAEDRPQAWSERRRSSDTLGLAAAVIDRVDRAQHQRLGAAGRGVAGKRCRLLLAGRSSTR